MALVYTIPAGATVTCNIAPASPLFSGAYNSAHGFGGVKSGESFQVTAAGSTGSGSLSHAWTITSSPGGDSVTWSAQNVANPTLSSLGNFGTYVLQDAITDMDGTTNCPFKLGVVHSSALGVIDFAAEDPTNGAKLAKIIGPQTRIGVSQWPWWDDRAQFALDYQIDTKRAVGGQYYGYWKTVQTGTITITGSSATVTGSGTDFQNTTTGPCDTGSSTPEGGAFLWWLDGSGNYTKRGISVCGSDTSITISQAYPSNATAGALAHCDTPCAGLTYGFGWDGDGSAQGWSSVYAFGNSPANYYDNVVALYVYYFRSGLGDYQTAARSMADDWWASPEIDRGYGCDISAAWSNCVPRRSLSITGIIIRALDGNSGMFTGLRAAIWPRCTFYVERNTINGEIDDIRDQAYMQACLADGAIAETDAGEATAIQVTLAAAAVPQWQDFQQANGGFVAWYSTGGSIGNATTVAATNGSATVTVSGGTCPTSTGQTDNIWYFWSWPSTPGTRPASPGTSGDSTYYNITCNGTSTITLDRVYEGTTGSGKGWSYGQPFTGWGCQAYMCGLLGIAFEQSAIALDGYSGNTARDVYRSMADELAVWQQDYAYDVTNTGLYSGVFSICGHPVSSTDKMCGTVGQSTDPDRRWLSTETIRAVGMSYVRTQTASLKTYADLLLTQLACKASTNCGFSSTADFIASLDSGGFYVNYTTTSGAYPGAQAKFTGQGFGFANSPSWNALRLDVVSTPVFSNGSVTGPGTVR